MASPIPALSITYPVPSSDGGNWEDAKTAYTEWAHHMGLSAAFEQLSNREMAAWCAAARALQDGFEDEFPLCPECGVGLTCSQCEDPECSCGNNLICPDCDDTPPCECGQTLVCPDCDKEEADNPDPEEGATTADAASRISTTGNEAPEAPEPPMVNPEKEAPIG